MLCQYANNLNNFSKFLSISKHLNIGSLGPVGTTTYEATKYLTQYIDSLNYEITYDVILFNTFDKIFENLKNEKLDMVIIPNPYENITRFYWDEKIHFIFSFDLLSPKYGIAALTKEVSESNKKLKIASGPAIDSLFDKLYKFPNKENISFYNVNSTKEAVLSVEDGEADLAITNNTSIKGTNLSFITNTIHATILWSIFISENNYQKLNTNREAS